MENWSWPSKRTTVRRSKTVTSGIVHIQSTFNNTIVSVTDDAAFRSVGPLQEKDIRGSKSTPYAAQIVTKEEICSTGC